jgi:uncharacterized Fe-S cluster-containing protein
MTLPTTTYSIDDLPGLNCGVCGLRTCEEMASRLQTNPEMIKRCIYLSDNRYEAREVAAANLNNPLNAPVAPQTFVAQPVVTTSSCAGCGSASTSMPAFVPGISNQWRDSLGREFDFYLEHFPEDPGPREIIIPHNPMITRELDVQVGDVLIGRPLGMSCGCPITHCGVAMSVDKRTGVMTWCVTGPLNPRQKGFKDLGYYIAEGYEGMVHETRSELKIGARYYFQPRMCMLQWRHSGLVNFMNCTADGGYQIRLEGLWIG